MNIITETLELSLYRQQRKDIDVPNLFSGTEVEQEARESTDCPDF